MENNNNKKRYNFCNVQKLGEGKFAVTLKGWVVNSEKNQPKAGTATINGVKKDTFNFLVASTVAKSKMKFLGLDEADTMFTRCSAISEPREGITTVVDRLKKAGLEKGALVLLVGTLIVKTEEDGKQYRTFYIDDFEVERRKKAVTGNEGSNSGNDDIPEVTDDGDMPF